MFPAHHKCPRVRPVPVCPVNCTPADCSSAASPAKCGSAVVGSVVVAAGTTSTVVLTTAVTTSSRILVKFDAGLGAKLRVTCNAVVPATYGISDRAPGRSFTISSEAPVGNPACFSYVID